MAAGGLLAVVAGVAHENTWPAMQAFIAQVEAARLAGEPRADSPRAILALQLRFAESAKPCSGLVRVTPLDEPGAPALALPELFERPAGWHSMEAATELRLPRARLRVEAVHGIETEMARAEVDLRDGGRRELALELRRMFDARAAGFHAANTHLHLIVNARPKMGVMLRDRAAADRYLLTTAHSDGLDLVCVSYLTRPDEVYVSNDYTAADFERWSRGPTLFVDGIEHRHAGVRDAEQALLSYGHVLLVGAARRSVPASIGFSLAGEPGATDGVPLRIGMSEARRRGAAVIWCHGMQGAEWVPDIVDGLAHAQNIHDGGTTGTFDQVYYPFLNLGLRLPFSTGTDWGAWDFSRVYVAAPAEFSGAVFVAALAAGRTFITNEPWLEFRVNDAGPGDTVEIARGATLRVHGRAVCRSDFQRVEVVCNGRVLHTAAARSVGGHFEAEIDTTASADVSGWLALRIAPENIYEIRSRYSGPGSNILGKAIFAHTSPIYVTVAGRPLLDAGAARLLAARVDAAVAEIERLGKFANSAEREGVLAIYRNARLALDQRLAATAGP